MTQDDDVLQALNARSSANVADLHYFVVPAFWMHKAWPLLSGKRDDISREQIGPIQSQDLLWGAVSDNEDEEETTSTTTATAQQQHQQKSLMLHELQKRAKNVLIDTSAKPTVTTTSREERFARRHDHQHHAKAGTTLHPQKAHLQDFFLLGPSTWLLLKTKFGYDQEVKRKCALVEINGATTLAVVLQDKHQGKPAVYEAIPPSGRFGYEAVLDKDLVAAGEEELQHPGNVSDDDTDLVS